jgi:hypothetical protein
MAARNAVVIALLVSAWLVTMVASHANGDRQLLAAQGAGNPQAPNKPSSITRKEWDPKFSAATGDRKLMAVQGFKAPQLEPAKPKSPDSKRFTATTTTGTGATGVTGTGNRHLMAAQGAGNPQAPNKPSAVTRKEWGPKFSAASGDRKLMAVQGFKAPQLEPAKPKSPDSKRFTATTTTGTGNRHLLAAQGAGNPQAPKKPSAVNRKEWGPNFSAASGDRKL